MADYVARMEEMRTMYINLSCNFNHFGDLDLDRKIILKCVLEVSWECMDFIILIKDGIHGQDLENMLMSIHLMRRW